MWLSICISKKKLITAMIGHEVMAVIDSTILWLNWDEQMRARQSTELNIHLHLADKY